MARIPLQPEKIAPAPGAVSGNGTFLEVWRLAYPVIITMASVSMMGVVDTFFMGRVGISEQGAVGLGAVLSWTLLSFFNGNLTAGNTFVAQSYGAGKLEECGRMVWQVFYLALVSSVLVLAAVYPFIEPLVRAVGAGEALSGFAVDYMSIRLAGAPLVFIDFCVVGFLRGIGDTRTPMKITLAANVLNVVLTWLLVFGQAGLPALGVRGAALGTVLSQVVEAGVYLAVFFGPAVHRRFQSRRFSPPQGELLYRLLRVGLPTGAWWVLEMGGFTVFSAFVSTLGDVPMAGHQIVRQLVHLSFLPGVALSIAATTLVGQYIGAGDIPSAERSARTAIKIALVIMGSMGLLFVLVRVPLARLFNPDPRVVEIAGRLFIFAAVFQLFDALGTVASGAVRGAGDTRWPMWASLAMTWLVFIPGVLFLGGPAGWGVYGAWTGATLYISLLGLLLYARFRGGRWKSMKI